MFKSIKKVLKTKVGYKFFVRSRDFQHSCAWKLTGSIFMRVDEHKRNCKEIRLQLVYSCMIYLTTLSVAQTIASNDGINEQWIEIDMEGSGNALSYELSRYTLRDWVKPWKTSYNRRSPSEIWNRDLADTKRVY